MSENGHIQFSSLLSPKEILCHIEEPDAPTVIRRLLERLALQRGIGNVDAAYQAVMDREASMSTVVAPGIAMPHARLDGLTDLSVAVATSKTGIAWGDAKTGAVYLVLLILAPKDSPAMYLQVISSLAKIFGDPEAPKAVAGMETAEEVWKFFDRGGLLLPDHICAGDIMNRDVVLVRETDPLEKAIDTFVDKDMVVLPVVDRDGELVGVVTAAELMRVCLPDYILWMDDLSPILNFEPFAQVLRNESKTWLAEIMRFDHAVVSVDAPAIDVAKELTKRGCREAFVLNGKKLVGVITLRDFLNKVLRE